MSHFRHKGIKQKGILVTCSYEARRRGVRKLSTVGEGLRCCPEMVLVNGEDLSFFRRLSTQCWRLVRSLVWGHKVEKLGLDELFCDVTEMIDMHCRIARGSINVATDPSKRYTFNVIRSEDSVHGDRGFTYSDCDPIPGQVLPARNPHDNDTDAAFCDPSGQSEQHQQQQRLILGARLASFLRETVLAETDLTMSAGISHNKLLAKLISSKHKPCDQTLLLPAKQDDITNLLDSHSLRSLMGFGNTTIGRVKEKLLGSTAKDSAILQTPFEVSVSMSRKTLELGDWIGLFGTRLGPRLCGLVQGHDEDDVSPAPLFPLQIGVENSYRGLRGQAIVDELRRLSYSLLRRLEAELVDDDLAINEVIFERRNEPLDLTSEQGKGQAVALRGIAVRHYYELSRVPLETVSSNCSRPRNWKRYPLMVRLSIRQGWDHRKSRQTGMPTEIFNLMQSVEQRAKTLCVALLPVLRSLLRQETSAHGISLGNSSAGNCFGVGLNLINLAAVNLVTKRPAPALDSFFGGFSNLSRANGTSPGKRSLLKLSKSTAIDLDTLAELPEDLRNEVIAQYKMQMPSALGKHDTATSAGPQVLSSSLPSRGLANLQTDEEVLICERCGVAQRVWLQHDHLLWPIQGVPPCLVTTLLSSKGNGPAPVIGEKSRGLSQHDGGEDDDSDGRVEGYATTNGVSQ